MGYWDDDIRKLVAIALVVLGIAVWLWLSGYVTAPEIRAVR
jgi:hypothetical protein